MTVDEREKRKQLRDMDRYDPYSKVINKLDSIIDKREAFNLANRMKGVNDIYHYGKKEIDDDPELNEKQNAYAYPTESMYDNQYYEQQTAVSEDMQSNRNYETDGYNDMDYYNPPDIKIRSPHEDVRVDPPIHDRNRNINEKHYSTEKPKNNDEMLSLLVGEKAETNEQKRARQKKYREDLERQKRINSFYTRNLNPEVIERSISRSPPRHVGDKVNEHLEEQKSKKQEELRKGLQEQIEEKNRLKTEEKRKQAEYERKLDIAIENMNKKHWDEVKTESQREKDKEMLKEELQYQINERKNKEDFLLRQKKLQEIEEEKRVKREIFDLNNQYRIENGLEPLPLPQELQPANIQHELEMANQNFLKINDDRSMHPSMNDGYQYGGAQSMPRTPMNPNYQYSNHPDFPPNYYQNMSPDMSMMNQPYIPGNQAFGMPPQNYYQNPQMYPSSSPYPQNQAEVMKIGNFDPQLNPSMNNNMNVDSNIPQNQSPSPEHSKMKYWMPQPPPTQPLRSPPQSQMQYSPTLDPHYGELQELRDKQKTLIQSYVDEINSLKQQKHGIVQEMIESKKKQMEDEHKIFQNKLNELKSSVINTQNEQQHYALGTSNSVIAKGNSILEELDLMKQRLQKARSSKVEYPSDRTRTNIVIENPMVIDTTDYRPIKPMPQPEMEKSLPNKKVMKQNPTPTTNTMLGLKNAEQFDQSINERMDVSPKHESKTPTPMSNQNKSITKLENKVIQNANNFENNPHIVQRMQSQKLFKKDDLEFYQNDDQDYTEPPHIEENESEVGNDLLPASFKKTMAKSKFDNKELKVESRQRIQDKSFESESVMVKPASMLQLQDNNKSQENTQIIANKHIQRPQVVEIENTNPMKQSQIVKKYDVVTDITPNNNTSPMNHNQFANQVSQFENISPIRDEGGRPKSPIIPALQKKLTLAKNSEIRAQESLLNNKGLRKSPTQIGEQRESDGVHIRIDDMEHNNSQHIEEESKIIGKPPLSHQMSQKFKGNKLIDSIEMEFQNSKHKKFTDLIS